MVRGTIAVLALLLVTQIAKAETAKPVAPPQGNAQQRAQLRHCAGQWAKLKRSGDANGKLWRDFAATCEGK